MPSPLERTFSIWNRKAHYYLGLYFLFFLWLFALTGLLLNHAWKFAEFFPNRTVTKFERTVQPSTATDDLSRARDVMRKLGLQGEVEWTAAPVASGAFSFRVARPGQNWQVNLNPAWTRANVEQTEFNAWGVMRTLHTFTGARMGDERNDRDWIVTTLWAFSMDAVAAGLLIMVGGGLYLWFGLPAKRKWGAVALASGSLACGLFVFGLRWLY